eukprot:m.59671 g.59671  ORF g.59671 m.59671 type:complete len:87 (-) comp13010_c0_seq1:267-527(-)
MVYGPDGSPNGVDTSNVLQEMVEMGLQVGSGRKHTVRFAQNTPTTPTSSNNDGHHNHKHKNITTTSNKPTTSKTHWVTALSANSLR